MNSPEESPNVLITALSGRALAGLARKAGYRPLVADLFGDMDTRRDAHALCVVGGSLAEGFDAKELSTAIAELERRADSPPIGLICGAGFEDRPNLLADLGRDRRLLGCLADVVAEAKNPLALSGLCARLDVPHPQVSLKPPADPRGWLAKEAGGSGGWHIGEARGHAHTADTYYQRWIGGDRISALVLGTGREAAIVGWSAQWVDPTHDVPYRWAGAVQPARLEPALAEILPRKAIEITIAASLAGLASLDFLVDGHAWHLLEINPRPGGTLDIFDDGRGSLFESHVQACRGRLIPPPRGGSAQACAIVFAERDIQCMPEMQWPDWCADLQAAGTHVAVGNPVCTVRAVDDDALRARRLVEDRRRSILHMVHDPQREPAGC
ncbi:MAG: ATP-grasp domain-containing protein [Beijerinckiaceae bacterium]